MRVLISRAGIAGPCLAYWLSRRGFEPTLVERAPRLRSGGYIIDFWGAGFDVAERMGITSQLLERGYKVGQLRQVDRNGKPVSKLSMSVFERLTNGRYTSLPRSALSECLYAALGDRVETIFGESVVAFEEMGRELRVRFEHNASRSFDLVVGADGLHSRVRQLVFGEEEHFERFLGMKVAAFTAKGYRPRDEHVYVIHRDVGCQVGRFSMRDDRTMFLFVFGAAAPEILEARWTGLGSGHGGGHLPVIGDLAVDRDLRDRIEIVEY